MKNYEKDNKILIIEDDEDINRLIKTILEQNGFEVDSAFSGTEGELLYKYNKYDLILLDLMLPGLSGEDFIKRIRENSLIPIIVISAKVSMDDRVKVLRMGANDYIKKPFEIEDILVRVEVQLRDREDFLKRGTDGNKGEHGNILSYEEMEVNLDNRTVFIGDNEIHLTNSEFEILVYLIRNPDKAISKRNLYEKVWNGVYLGEDNTVTVHVSNIRKKIAKYSDREYIKTIWGIGFKLV